MQKPLINDPARKGQLAAAKRLIGAHNRYAVAPVFTRFDAVEWFVWDAELADPATGEPAIIRQEPTEEEAREGLPVCNCAFCAEENLA